MYIYEKDDMIHVELHSLISGESITIPLGEYELNALEEYVDDVCVVGE